MKTLNLSAISLCLFLTACGTERQVETANGTGGNGGTTAPAPTTPVTPGTGATSFAELLPTLNTYCVPCHQSSAYFKSEAAFRASDAQERAASGNMPPPVSKEAKNLSATDRKRIVGF